MCSFRMRESIALGRLVLRGRCHNLCLWVLVRMDHHGLLLVFLLDLLGRGIDADVHQLVESSIDRVNLGGRDQDVFRDPEVIYVN